MARRQNEGFTRESPMSKLSQPSVLMSQKNVACAVTGLLMGQIVMGIAAMHEDGVFGLTLALVFVLSGSASLVLFLSHLHAEQRPRTEPAPFRFWMLTIGATLVGSISLGRFL